MGLYTYTDPLAEFSASSVGKQVYLADSSDGHGVGAITLTPPSAAGALKQAVGAVVSYNSGVVSVNFAPIANEKTTFDNVLSGTSLSQALVVSNGSSLTFSGSGTINASKIFGTNVSAAASVVNQAPVYSGSAYVPTVVEIASNWRVTRYGVDQSPPVAISIPAGTLGGPYTVNFSSAFADNNYTVVATVEVGEAMSTAPCYVGGVQKQAAGVGVTVWVANNDSISHTVTINCVARHD